MILVSGIVRAIQGDPLKDARIFLVEGPQPYPDIAVLSDVLGKFSISVGSPGLYTLSCHADGFKTKMQTFEAAKRQSIHLEIILERQAS
ncbi:carboxypeptidase-like regulatory domain-containing protein [Candidatus Bipolaricaulota bacterium]|nr:carboxypeptidase-like regulatory domain-containing protein [Candidatus Bipolaricaulota bacterium]